MSTLSANRRTVPAIPDVQAASDGPCIRIPRSAFSINGFRRWVLSDELPEKLRLTYCGAHKEHREVLSTLSDIAMVDSFSPAEEAPAKR